MQNTEDLRKRHTRPLPVVAVLVAAVLAVAPASAFAGENPLLSGYGGPGAGEQQVIGATIVGEGESGKGGGSNGGSTQGETAETESAAPKDASTGQTGSGQGATPGSSKSGSKRSTKGAAASGGKGSSGSGGSQSAGEAKASEGASAKSTAAPISRTIELAADRSSTLGLSGGQLLGVVLAAIGLLLIALLTWRLVAIQPKSEPADTDLVRPGSR